MKLETKAIHTGVDKNIYGTCSTPIYQSVAYRFKDAQQAEDRFALKDSGPIYSRITNPTESALAERLEALFGGPAIALASGSAAVFYSILNLCVSGDKVLVAKNVYGGTYDLFSYTLPRLGITPVWFNSVDIVDSPSKIETLIATNKPKLAFVEVIANPNAEITDIEALHKLLEGTDTKLIVDNTFAPLICQPFDFGADVVIHSTTKFISGNGSTIGGCIVENPKSDWHNTLIDCEDASYHGLNFADVPAPFTTRVRCVILRDTGACIAPQSAWNLLNGLETLPLRIQRHCVNAGKVLQFLKNKSIKIHHCAFDNPAVVHKLLEIETTPIFTIEVGSFKEDAKRFCNALKLFYQLANVGDAKSLVTHPATTTHSQLSDEELAACNISPTTVRLSIGLEDSEDIIADLEQALSVVQ